MNKLGLVLLISGCMALCSGSTITLFNSLDPNISGVNANYCATFNPSDSTCNESQDPLSAVSYGQNALPQDNSFGGNLYFGPLFDSFSTQGSTWGYTLADVQLEMSLTQYNSIAPGSDGNNWPTVPTDPNPPVPLGNQILQTATGNNMYVGIYNDVIDGNGHDVPGSLVGYVNVSIADSVLPASLATSSLVDFDSGNSIYLAPNTRYWVGAGCYGDVTNGPTCAAEWVWNINPGPNGEFSTNSTVYPPDQNEQYGPYQTLVTASENAPPEDAPEPSALILVGGALIGLGVIRRKNAA